MSRGRIEARIYQPSNWTATVTGSASGTATITASSARYPSDLLAAVAAAFSTTTGDTVTVTGSLGESGTGLVTIASSANIAVTWVSTSLRDILGFTGNLSSGTPHLSTRPLRGVWLPNAEGAFPYGPGDEGHTETDLTTTESPSGDIKGLVYNSRVVLPSARWSHVPRRYARAYAESQLGESFETWWKWTQQGTLDYFLPVSPVRLYWSADAGDYKTYRIASRRGTEMPRTDPNWAGLFDLSLDRLVRIPGT